jgi:hypothetical protein
LNSGLLTVALSNISSREFKFRDWKPLPRISCFDDNYIENNVAGGVSADAQKYPDSILIKVEGSSATYILTREEDGAMMKYTLYFAKDDSGLWRIAQY